MVFLLRGLAGGDWELQLRGRGGRGWFREVAGLEGAVGRTAGQMQYHRAF